MMDPKKLEVRAKSLLESIKEVDDPRILLIGMQPFKKLREAVKSAPVDTDNSGEIEQERELLLHHLDKIIEAHVQQIHKLNVEAAESGDKIYQSLQGGYA